MAISTAHAPARDGPALGTGRVELVSLGSVRLESGVELDDVVAAYRHDGLPPPAPQALAVHALTGSADAAGDWWAPLIGPGLALDTERGGVLGVNLLGGNYGSTGPSSIDPATGRPFERSFPDVTVRDQARFLWLVADVLGIERIEVATGGSLGGMIALEVALERPDAVDVVVPIAAPASTGALAIAWNHIQLELVDRLGEDGMALARQLAMTTYRSEIDFDGRFGRDRGRDGRFAVVSYLDHQGEKLVERFDPDTYRVLARTIDSHDIGRGRGGVIPALRRLAASGTRLTGAGVVGDILYGPAQVLSLLEAARTAGVDTTYREIRSTKGHDAFLVEWDQLTAIIRDAVAGRSPQPSLVNVEAGAA